MTTTGEKLRALALAALMVLSVVAMGVSITGSAVAQPSVTLDTTDEYDVYPDVGQLNDDDDDLPGATAGSFNSTLTVTGESIANASLNVTVDEAGLQLWANDGNGWTDIVDVGHWGPAPSFPIDASYNNTTRVFVAGDPGTYEVTTRVENESGHVFETETGNISIGIQHGVNNATGDEVTVAPGLYEERVVIDTANVELVAPDGGATVRYAQPLETNNPGRPTIDVMADGVTVDGFTIQLNTSDDYDGGERFAQGVKVGGFQANGGSGTTVANSHIEFLGENNSQVTSLGVGLIEPANAANLNGVTVQETTIEGFEVGAVTSGDVSDADLQDVHFTSNDVQIVDDSEAFDAETLDENTFDKATYVLTEAGSPRAPPTVWSTVGDAIGQAEDGDTVGVLPGTYEETIDVPHNISIVAPDGATLAPGENERAIQTGGELYIEGLTVQSDDGQGLYANSPVHAVDSKFVNEPGPSADAGYAVRLEGPPTDGSVFENVTFTGHKHAIVSAGASDLLVTGSNLSDSHLAGVIVSTGTGGTQSNVSNVTITESRLSNNGLAGVEVVEDGGFNVTEPVDARFNLWNGGDNPADHVNGSVDHDPWYEDAGLSTLSNEEDDSPSPPSISTGDDDDEEEQQETPTPSGDEPPAGDVERQATKEIADEDPDTPGTTVRFDAEESSVNEITFDDEDDGSGGSVTVTEYSEVPDELQDANGNEVVFAVDINVPEDRRDSSATVTMTLSEDRLGDRDPADARVAHRQDDGTWVLLETEVVTTGDGEVTLRAVTDGFSVFGVAFQQAEEPADTPTPVDATPTAAADTAQPTDEPVEEPAGFDLQMIGIVLVLALVVVALFVLARRRY